MNPTAIDTFITTKTEIDALLARIKQASDNHFGASPDKTDWGHVGSVTHWRDQLRQISDAIFNEGEHR